MADERRVRLANAIEARRKELGLSLSAAARAAGGMDRGTWTAAERGTRDTEDYIYAAIERALQWLPGSAQAVLAGGQPSPGVAVMAGAATAEASSFRATAANGAEGGLVAEARRIEALPISGDEKIELFKMVVRMFEQRAREAKTATRSG